MSSTSSTVTFNVGDKQYILKPAPLKMLKKIWVALPKVTGSAREIQQLITAAGSVEGAGDSDFMAIHAQRVDVLVDLLCEAAGIPRQEADDNMTRDQVDNLTGTFNEYLAISGFMQTEDNPDPNVATAPQQGPQSSTGTGTPLRLN
jgi:hypothetical protein